MVKPKFSKQSGPYADAPKLSIEMQAPSNPVHFCQQKNLEANTTTCLSSKELVCFDLKG